MAVQYGAALELSGRSSGASVLAVLEGLEVIEFLGYSA